MTKDDEDKQKIESLKFSDFTNPFYYYDNSGGGIFVSVPKVF